MSDQMLIRISSETKDSLKKIARSEGKSTSQVVREIISDYIQDRDISAYVDELWTRIGKKLKDKGITPLDIPDKIRQIRESGK
jgi:predicted DNA-binding protein